MSAPDMRRRGFLASLASLASLLAARPAAPAVPAAPAPATPPPAAPVPLSPGGEYRLAYSAHGLPSGLTIDPTTGLITGGIACEVRPVSVTNVEGSPSGGQAAPDATGDRPA